MYYPFRFPFQANPKMMPDKMDIAQLGGQPTTPMSGVNWGSLQESVPNMAKPSTWPEQTSGKLPWQQTNIGPLPGSMAVKAPGEYEVKSSDGWLEKWLRGEV